MSTRRFDALAVAATLSYAMAVAAHALVHVLTGEAVEWLSGAHVVMAFSAGLALAYAANRLGWGAGAAEARRRCALHRAALRGAMPGRTVVLQAVLIAALLVSEGSIPSARHLAGSVIATIVAAILAAFALRSSRVVVDAIVATWESRGAVAPHATRHRTAPFVVTALAGGAFLPAALPVRAP